ncbi:Response regulator UvrY [compost metagenome]
MESTETIRVAYAEDHFAMREGLKLLLDGNSFIKIGPLAADGIQMLKALEQTTELPHVCLIDINMPEMDGFSLQQEISHRWPNIKTLILSMYNEEPFIIKMISMGAKGYLHKNAETDEIVRAIHSVHKYGYYHNDLLDEKRANAIHTNKLKLPKFTEREISLLRLIHTDKSYTEIALELGTTTRSIEGYRDRLFGKLNISSRVGLAMYAVKYGWAPLDNPGKKIL